MKKILMFSTVALIGLAAFTGCKKSDSPSYAMSATVGTTSFNATNCIAAQTNGGLIITGWNGTTAAPPMIDIALINWGGSATTINFDTTLATGYEEYVTSISDPSVNLESKTGTLTITSVSSTNIAGTFSFTANDGTVISGGTFNAKVE